MKKCRKCGKEKNRIEFWDNKKLKDGLQSYCKECSKKESGKYRKTEKWNDFWKKYRKMDKYAEYRRKYQVERIKNPVEKKKHLCRIKTNYLVSTGVIKKLGCANCGDNKAEAHHSNYNYPERVVWLCRKHHRLIHNKLKQ
jgi:hypothetical protein